MNPSDQFSANMLQQSSSQACCKNCQCSLCSSGRYRGVLRSCARGVHGVQGIVVRMVNPGAVKTPIWSKATGLADELLDAAPPQAAALYGRLIQQVSFCAGAPLHTLEHLRKLVDVDLIGMLPGWSLRGEILHQFSIWHLIRSCRSE